MGGGAGARRSPKFFIRFGSGLKIFGGWVVKKTTPPPAGGGRTFIKNSLMAIGLPPPGFTYIYICTSVFINTGGILPGKINFGKNLSEISGQYFYQGVKPRDRNFPAVFKESSISSSYGLKI